MKKEIIMTENAPAAFGPFCQAMKAKGFIFTSGILPLDPSTGKKVEGGIERETRPWIILKPFWKPLVLH